MVLRVFLIIKRGELRMKIAAFCGTFDPVTYGHLDIIERASKLFDQLVVFISPNSDKNNEFTEEKD